jgi:small-conductance mechanosensitive channel
LKQLSNQAPVLAASLSRTAVAVGPETLVMSLNFTMKKPVRLTIFYLLVGFFVVWITWQGYLPISQPYINPILGAVGFIATLHVFSSLSDELILTHGDTKHTRSLANTIRYVGFFAATLVFLFYMRVDAQLLLVGGSVGGIVLGFAAQKTVENVFAGVVVLTSKQFEIGDRILIVSADLPKTYVTFPAYKFYSQDYLIQGYDAVVEEIGIFFTKVTLEKGLSMTLPNSFFLTSGIVNITKSMADSRPLISKVRFEFPLTLDPSSTIHMIRERLTPIVELRGVFISEKNQEQKTFIVIVEVYSHAHRESHVRSCILNELIMLEKEMCNDNVGIQAIQTCKPPVSTSQR